MMVQITSSTTLPRDFQLDGFIDLELARHTPLQVDALAMQECLAQVGQNAAAATTGRWGEALGHLLLQQHYPEYRVVWVNESRESFWPFDVLVERGDGAQVFVEVKSTSRLDKEIIELSHKEWLFAQQHQDSYHILRVFGAQSDSPLCEIIENPFRLVSEGKLRICLRI